MRTLVALLSAAVLLVSSACSRDEDSAHPYGVQSAAIGESQSVLGWNMSLANLRFDGDYVLFDIDASPTQADGPHAKPEDIRFGLYGALAHPLEANAIGGCRDVTSLAVQPAAAPTPDRLSGTVCLGPMRDQSQVRGAYVYSPKDRMAGTTVSYPAPLPGRVAADQRERHRAGDRRPRASTRSVPTARHSTRARSATRMRSTATATCCSASRSAAWQRDTAMTQPSAAAR